MLMIVIQDAYKQPYILQWHSYLDRIVSFELKLHLQFVTSVYSIHHTYLDDMCWKIHEPLNFLL